MYTFNDPVTKNAIEERLSHYQIYKYYYPALEIGRVVISPLRKEQNASFGIFKANNGKLKFNDLANQDSGDVFEFVQTLFTLSFNDALHKINQDFNLRLTPNRANNNILPTTKGIVVNDITINSFKHTIYVITRPWNINDEEYWAKVGLTIDEVKKSNTKPIAAYRIDAGLTVMTDKLAYSMDFYDEGDGIMMRKIYQPYSTESK